MMRTSLLLLLALAGCDSNVDYDPLDTADTSVDTDAEDTDVEDTDIIDDEGWSQVDPSDTYPWSDVELADAEALGGPPVGTFNDMAAFEDGTLLGLMQSMVWASEDGGVTWDLRGQPDTTYGTTLAVHEGDVFMAGYEGVFRSSDGGRTWTSLAHDERFAISDLSVSDGELLLQSRSQDAAWILDGDAFVEIPMPEEAFAFTVFAHEGRLLAATPWLESLFVSEDLGRSWTLLSAASVGTVVHADGDTLWGMDSFQTVLRRSDDGGVTWSDRGTLPFNAKEVFLSGGLIFARGNSGLVVSEDGGLTFEEATDGLPGGLGQNINGFVAREDGDVLVSTWLAGVWHWVGDSFARIDDGLPGGAADGMAVHGDAVLAAFGSHGVWKLEDGAWTEWASVGITDRATDVAVTHGGVIIRAHYDGFHTTTDGTVLTQRGATLPDYNGSAGPQTMPMGQMDTRGTWAFAPMNTAGEGSSKGDHWLVGGGIAVTWDNGESWEWAVWDLPVREVNPFGKPVYDSGTAVRALSDRVLLGTAGAGVYVSTDKAETWEASSGIPSDEVVVDLAEVDGGLVAATRGYELGAGGIYVSENGGYTWTPGTTGLPEGLLVDDLIDADGVAFALDVETDTVWKLQDGAWTLFYTSEVDLAAPMVQYGDRFLLNAGPRGLFNLVPAE